MIVFCQKEREPKFQKREIAIWEDCKRLLTDNQPITCDHLQPFANINVHEKTKKTRKESEYMKKTLIVYGSTTGNMESSVPHLSPTTLFVTHKVNM